MENDLGIEGVWIVHGRHVRASRDVLCIKSLNEKEKRHTTTPIRNALRDTAHSQAVDKQ